MTSDRLSHRYRLLLKLVIAAALLVAIGVLVQRFVVRPMQKAAIKTSEGHRVKMIAIALDHFNDTHRRLPPAMHVDKTGLPLSSWRFQITPFLESMMIDIPFGTRWDDPANRLLASWTYPPFCWSGDRPHTTVVAITGPGTAFDEAEAYSIDDMDGDTILIVEMADSQIHWMEPGDLPVDAVTESILHGEDGDGFWVAFADGSTMYLRPDVPLENVKKFLTVESAKRYDREQLLTPYAAYGR